VWSKLRRLSRLSLGCNCELGILSVLEFGLVPVSDITSQGFSLFADVFFWE
jgi:hypothetical protein